MVQERSRRQKNGQNWRANRASHSVERVRAWDSIMSLATRCKLPVETCGRYMLEPREWHVLQARYVWDPPMTLRVLGMHYDCKFEAIEVLELRGLLKLLTRLMAYEAALQRDTTGER